MSIQSLKDAVTTAGGSAASFNRIDLWRSLVAAWGGTPTQFTVEGLIREAIAAVGGTPTQFGFVPLLRELVTALGGTPETFEPDALEVQVAGLALLGPSYGPELVTNGTFDTDVSGWTQEAGTGMAWNSGRLRVTNSSADIIKTSVPTANGTTYRLTIDFPAATGSVRLEIGIPFDDQRYAAFIPGAFPSTYSVDFTVTSATPTVLRLTALTPAGTYFEIDNVSVKQVL